MKYSARIEIIKARKCQLEPGALYQANLESFEIAELRSLAYSIDWRTDHLVGRKNDILNTRLIGSDIQDPAGVYGTIYELADAMYPSVLKSYELRAEALITVKAGQF